MTRNTQTGFLFFALFISSGLRFLRFLPASATKCRQKQDAGDYITYGVGQRAGISVLGIPMIEVALRYSVSATAPPCRYLACLYLPLPTWLCIDRGGLQEDPLHGEK